MSYFLIEKYPIIKNRPTEVISNDGSLDNIVKYEYDGVGNITKIVTGITSGNEAVDASVYGVTTYLYNNGR